MSEKFQSYIQGYRDTCIELGDKVPNGYELGDSDYVSEDSLVLEEYLRGQVAALIAHIKREDAASAKAANDLSCHLNGIIPD